MRQAVPLAVLAMVLAGPACASSNPQENSRGPSTPITGSQSNNATLDESFKLLDQGEQLSRDGRFSEARDVFMEHLRRFGPSALTFTHLAYAERGLGNLTTAEAFAQRAIDLDRSFDQGFYYHGLIRYDQQDYAAALASYNQAIQLRPNEPFWLIDRGNAKYRLEDYEGALADYNQVENLDPTSALAPVNKAIVLVQQKLWNEAEDQARRAIALDPNLADAHRNLGYALQGQGKQYEALKSFDLALAKGAAPIDILRDKALALEDLNSPAEAITTADAALKLNPNAIDMVSLKARVANAQNRQKQLEKFVREAVARHLVAESDFTTYVQELVAMKHSALAYDVARQGALRHPNSRDVNLELGWAAYDVGRKQEALKAFERCTDLQPQRGANWADRGTLESELGQHDLALKHFDQAAALEPENALIHYNRGWAHLRIKNYEATFSSFQRALELEPDNLNINVDMGYLADVMGDYALAEKHARKALTLAPDNLVALGNLSDLLARNGKHAEARALAQKVRVLDPANSDNVVAVAFAVLQAGEIDNADALMKEARAMQAKKRTPMYYYVLGLLREKQNRLYDARENFGLALTSEPNEWYRQESEKGLARLR